MVRIYCTHIIFYLLLIHNLICLANEVDSFDARPGSMNTLNVNGDGDALLLQRDWLGKEDGQRSLETTSKAEPVG